MARISDANRIRRMLSLREEIRKDEAALKLKKAKLKSMEEKTISMLLSKDLNTMSTSGGTISINPEVVAQVNDWDAAFKYIKRKDAFYLMFKRINNAAWREEVAANRNRQIPGIDPFERYKLSLRVNSK